MRAAIRPAPPILVVTHPDAELVSVIDTTTSRIIGTVKVGGKVGAAALTGDGERLFVSVPDAIAVVNLAARRVERTLAMPGEHSGLAAAGDRLFVVLNTSTKGRVLAVDVATGRVEAEREIDHLAGRPEVSADGSRLYVPHFFYSGRVTILDARRLSVTTTLSFEDGTTRARLSPDQQTLLVPNGATSGGRVTLVDTDARRKTADIVLEDEPTDIAITPDGHRALVPLFRANSLAILNLETRTVTRTIPLEPYPIRLALSPDGRTAYVLRNATNRLSIVDLDSSAVTVHELEAEALDIVAPGWIGRP